MSRFKPELNFPTVISLIALFVGLGGGAYAAKLKLKQNSVKSKHIAPDAATGADVNESTFGVVPNATDATNATNAGNAATVGGQSANDLQFGDGFDDAAATLMEAGDPTTGIAVFEGALGFECDASPDLFYVDFGGDPFDTDLWANGAHSLIADGAGPGTVATAPGPSHTAQVQIWGGFGFVEHVVASVSFDATPTPDECAIAFNSQSNLDLGSVEFLSARGDRSSLESRRKLPDGWVAADGR